MSAFSNYLEDQITGWIAGTSMTAPTATFVQLYNGDPTDTGTLYRDWETGSIS